MKKKIFITALIIITFLIITGSLFIIKKENDTKKDLSEKVVEEGVVKTVKETTNFEIESKGELVWYEIPELGIKIQFPLSISNHASNREFYVEDSVFKNAREIYIDKQKIDKNSYNAACLEYQPAFAEVIVYDKDSDKTCIEESKTKLNNFQVCYFLKQNRISKNCYPGFYKYSEVLINKPKIEEL